MSVDREYRIRIATVADNTGAQQTSAELDKLKGKILDGVNPAWAEYGTQVEAATKVTDEVAESTQKVGLSHRELHMALAQLGPEFAKMGGMAQYALHNHMLAPVLAIVGAFALWEHRIKACVEALAGAELSDNVKAQVGQMGALAESWKGFNKSLLDAVTSYNSVDEASKRNIEILKAEEQQKKKLLEADKKLELSELERQKTALTTGQYETEKAAIEGRYEDKSAADDDEAQFKKMQAKAKQGADLVKSSKEKMAEAAKIKLGSPEQESAIDEGMKRHADEAEADAKKGQERLNDIFAHKDKVGNPAEQLAREGRLIGRYGLLGTAGAGLEEAIPIEKAGLASDQQVIDSYKKRMEGKAARDLAEERRKKLVADAGKEAGEAYKIWEEGPGDVAAYNKSVDNQHAVAATNAQTARNTADAKTLQSPEAKLISDVSAAESILQQGGEISIKQQSEIATLAEKMRLSHVQQGETIIQALGTIHENTEALTRRILDLAKKLDAQGKQIRNAASPP